MSGRDRLSRRKQVVEEYFDSVLGEGLGRWDDDCSPVLQRSELLGSCCEDEVLKHPCAIRVPRTRLSHDSGQISSQHEVNAVHLLDCRLPICSHKYVTQRPKKPSNCATMNADISSVQVAERLVDSVLHGFTNVPPLSSIKGVLRNSKAKFKRHVEPRYTGGSSVQFNSREVMNRIGALFDQFDYTLKPTLTGGDF